MKTKNKRPIRHGDVLVIPVDKLPEKLKQRPDLVLMEGEMTGHAHRITSGDATLFFDEKLDEQGRPTLYLKVDSPTAALTHEEHKRIDLPKGLYEIKAQRNYEPQGWRYVAD